MITFEQIFVLTIVVLIIISLYCELVGPAFTFMIAVTTLGLAGILSPKEMLSGFGNDQLAVIILLLLIGDIIRKAAVIEQVFDRVFRKAKSQRAFMVRMMALIASLSAFLNNTPLVAVMIPYVSSWCKRRNLAPSKLLIPLSYAAILGGCATLIGTSTNLIVNGFVADQTLVPQIKSMGLFDFAWVGGPMIIIGIVYMVVVSNKLLPSHASLDEDYAENARNYMVEAQVREGSHLIGKTVEEANLRNLKQLFLVKILRADMKKIKPVSPDEIIKKNDRLFFAGNTSAISEMIDVRSGLTLPEVGQLTKQRHTEVVEIVISHNSTLIAKTVKEANFRGKYDAAIIGIHRNGERVSGKIGDVKLRAGDVLILLAGGDLKQRGENASDFYFISKVRKISKIETYKVVTLLGGTALAILASAFGFINLFLALVLLLIVILGLKIASPKDLPKSVDYNLALIISMSIALGTAMTKTGAAALVANIFVEAFMPFGTTGLLTGIFIITSLLAAYITYTAAIALVFPIALSMAVNLQLDPVPFILITAHAAAANFMSPVGYQTNLMVYGPGGYSFRDFFRIGFPLTVMYLVVSVVILQAVFF